LRHEAF